MGCLFVVAEIEEPRQSNGIMRGEREGFEIKSDNYETQDKGTLYNVVECWRGKEKGKRKRESLVGGVDRAVRANPQQQELCREYWYSGRSQLRVTREVRKSNQSREQATNIPPCTRYL